MIPRRLPVSTCAALLIAVSVVSAALRDNAWAVGGADSAGYAAQADQWLTFRALVPLPLAATAPWPSPESSFTPLGYRPAMTRGAMVPTYPPGLPLLAAAAQLAGGRDMVHLVVPCLAGLTIWLTFVLARRLGGATAGLVAAIGLATSPIVLRQSTQLMSDVPAAAWWTLALVLAGGGTSRAAFGAGLASGAAILTRPNLVPAAAAVGAVVVACARRRARGSQPDRWWHDRRVAHLAAWLIGVVPACLAVAGIHSLLYGSPLRSGYGASDDLYAATNIGANLSRYAAWLAATESPLLALCFGAGLVRRIRGEPRPAGPDGGASPAEPAAPVWPLLLFVAIVVASYLPYAVWDAWWYTRFLLPAMPAAFALASVTLTAICYRVAGRYGQVLALVVSVAFALASVASVRSLGSLGLAANERRYPLTADAFRAESHQRPIAVAGQHSGSLRYYTGAPVLRWDMLPPGQLDAALAHVQHEGYLPLIALDAGEVIPFRERFTAASDLGRLDWPPAVDLRTPTPVRIYDPAQRAMFMAGQRIHTRTVFAPRR